MAETEGKVENNASGWAGVIKLLLNVLGGAASTVVIVSGILLALYYFTEQNTRIRQETEKLNEEKRLFAVQSGWRFVPARNL